jgi:thiol-disulfide isomerase/thioredoxin
MMRGILGTSAATFALCGLLAIGGNASAQDRTADQIVKEIKAVKLPTMPADRTDQAALQAYVTSMREANQQKAALIGELMKVDPANKELTTLLPIRWAALRADPANRELLNTETSQIIAKSDNQKLLGEAYYTRTFAAYRAASSGNQAELDNAITEMFAFAAKFPKDQRVASGFSAVAGLINDPKAKEVFYARIEKELPETPAAKMVVNLRARAEAERKKLEAIGKPFELEFTDAIKGTPVTMASLKGKVVVIDFWATWCGPCIAEMPRMKELYAQYKDEGVEFIGVSLDQPKEQGGLDKLKAYVAKNDIQWPQYYQGNFWQSEFSSSWGVNSIPCVFLVDADGNLASIQARGQLDKLIPEYLAKAKAKKTAANP